MTSRICAVTRFMQILFAHLLGLNSRVADDWTWLEGEDAVDRETTRHSWYDR